MRYTQYNETCLKFQARQKRFNRWWRIFNRINRKRKRGDWSKEKAAHWLRFITPEPQALQWIEARAMHREGLTYGPMASNVNPHTGERNERQL